MNHSVQTILLVCSFFIFPSSIHAISSAQDGPWSDSTTWFGGVIPSSGDIVTISTGHTVTLDVTTATAGGILIHGTLTFSPVKNSSLTVVQGDVIVNPGGSLLIGTADRPIQKTTFAHLILAYGSAQGCCGRGYFGLIVNDGGNFVVHGATKTSASTAAADISGSGNTFTLAENPASLGWSIGDVITIGPTQGYGLGGVAQKTIVAFASGNDIQVDTAFSTFHYATSTIRVCNLTHNALIRSSGTDAGSNAAYIRNLAQNTTSFDVSYGEFAHLGFTANVQSGIVFESQARGSISSSTIRNGYIGIYLAGAQNISLTYNRIYYNATAGIRLIGASNTKISSNDVYSGNGLGVYLVDSSNNSLAMNNFYSNADRGICLYNSAHNDFSLNQSFSNASWGGIDLIFSANNILISNNVYNNRNFGIWLAGSSGNTLTFNAVHHNSSHGFYFTQRADDNTLFSNTSSFNSDSGMEFLDTRKNLVISNMLYSNSRGIYVFGAQHSFISNRIYSNRGVGLYITGNPSFSSDHSVVGDSLGYDGAGSPAANADAEIYFRPDPGANRVVLKNLQINPTRSISLGGLNREGNYLVSYNQNFDTGTIRIWGDYLVTRSTLSVDYDSQLCRSEATSLKLMRGAGHSASVTATNDSNAISQMIMIAYDGVSSRWRVIGSSSGFMGNFTAPILDQPFPAVNPQFNLSFSQGSPQNGDTIDFALVAACGDQNYPKRLLVGPAASSFRNGRSKITVAPDGVLTLRGVTSNYSLMDRLDDLSTYYTFVDSGVFLIQFATISNTDSDGVQLAGSGGVMMSSSTFDFMGFSGDINSYLTARDLASSATFFNIRFQTSRSTVGAISALNVRTDGSDLGLRWSFINEKGPLAGEYYDGDANQRVSWSLSRAPPGLQGAALGTSSITWTWNELDWAARYNLFLATNIASGPFTSSVTSSTETQIGLATNTAYGVRVSAVAEFGQEGNLSGTATTYTLASIPSGLMVSQVHVSSVTIEWTSNGNPDATKYLASYWIQGETTGTLTTSTTNATLTGLLEKTTYYVQVRSINGDGILTAAADPIVVLTAFIPPLPPRNLSAISLGANKVRLDWEPSASTKTVRYNIYQASGTGAIDYTLLFASVPASETSYITPPLATGTYRFGLRAEAPNGNEENNTTIIASAEALSTLSGVIAAIKLPHAGQKLDGNRITIMAEIVRGSPAIVRQVEIQYRSTFPVTAPWLPVIAANLDHPNPDIRPPYFTYWDVTGLPQGNYELRAVVMDLDGVLSSNPPAIQIMVDHISPDVEEKRAGASYQKRERIFSSVDMTVRVGDGQTNTLSRVTLPAGAVNGTSSVLKIIVNPSAPPLIPAHLNSISQFRDISLENGQTQLARPAIMTLPYVDNDNDGLVDGILVRADRLAVLAYDPVKDAWIKEFPSTIDASSKTVTIQTNHFSLFGIFAPMASYLSDVLVYPVPYVPNDGNAENGKPFSNADPNSGILFDNLTQSIRIEIFTVSGELVWKTSTDSSSGRIQWNTQNIHGREVASGGYFAVVTDKGSGSKVVRKIAIIR